MFARLFTIVALLIVPQTALVYKEKMKDHQLPSRGEGEGFSPWTPWNNPWANAGRASASKAAEAAPWADTFDNNFGWGKYHDPDEGKAKKHQDGGKKERDPDNPFAIPGYSEKAEKEKRKRGEEPDYGAGWTANDAKVWGRNPEERSKHNKYVPPPMVWESPAFQQPDALPGYANDPIVKGQYINEAGPTLIPPAPSEAPEPTMPPSYWWGTIPPDPLLYYTRAPTQPPTEAPMAHWEGLGQPGSDSITNPPGVFQVDKWKKPTDPPPIDPVWGVPILPKSERYGFEQ